MIDIEQAVIRYIADAGVCSGRVYGAHPDQTLGPAVAPYLLVGLVTITELGANAGECGPVELTYTVRLDAFADDASGAWGAIKAANAAMGKAFGANNPNMPIVARPIMLGVSWLPDARAEAGTPAGDRSAVLAASGGVVLTPPARYAATWNVTAIT